MTDQAPREVHNFGKLTNGMKQIGVAFRDIDRASTAASFSLLDYRLSETPQEDRPERSWEIEREEFIRKQTMDPRDEQ